MRFFLLDLIVCHWIAEERNEKINKGLKDGSLEKGVYRGLSGYKQLGIISIVLLCQVTMSVLFLRRHSSSWQHLAQFSPRRSCLKWILFW